MTVSIWTKEATPEILAKALDLSKKYESSPELIFADLVNIKPQMIDLAQNALDVLDGTDSVRMEEIKASIEAVQKELLLMIISYEKLMEAKPAAAVCDNEYSKAIMMINIVDELRGHLKRRLFNLKHRI